MICDIMVNITYLGHSAFKVEGEKTLYIDPFLENPNSPISLRDVDEADVVLVTHGHEDHVGNAIEICEKTGATLVTIFDLAEILADKSDIIKTVGINIGGTTYVEDIEVTMVDAKHSANIEPGVSGGNPAGFVFKIDDTTIYYAGDTAVFGDMEIIGELYEPEIAMLPIGDFYTMGVKEANYAINLINPETVIPMHYDTFEAVEADPTKLNNEKAKIKIIEPGKTWET